MTTSRLRPAGRRAATPRASTVARLYDEIRARLVDGTYRPGQPLGEVELAGTHGASRTPVREALARLEQEGFVERVPNRGYFAARISRTQVEDVMAVRRALEGLGAERAARVATPDEVARLRAAAEFEYTLGDAVSYRRDEAANRAFHLAVARASHNQLIGDLVERCLTQMDRCLSLGIGFTPFPSGASGEHAAIVRAIERRDPAAARRAMERHLARTETLVHRALARGDLASHGA